MSSKIAVITTRENLCKLLGFHQCNRQEEADFVRQSTPQAVEILACCRNFQGRADQ